MTAWAYRLSQDAREVRDAWKPARQTRLQRAVEALAEQPTRGRRLKGDRTRVFTANGNPPLRITYRLNPKIRQLTVEHVAPVDVPLREIDVFLSYSSEDRDWFRRLRRALEPLRQLDIVLWSDEDLPPGKKWHPLIKEKVGEAGAAVLLVSEAFLRSEYIQAYELAPFVGRAEQVRENNHDRPFLLLWIPLTQKRWLERHEWGRRLLQFQGVIDPRWPLGAKPPLRPQRLLDRIRDLVLVKIHRALRGAAE
jgi:hypothetical protein